MRKIILGVAVSLDGFIEGPNGEYDWCFTDQDYGITEFLGNVDAILYGRKSYEMMMNVDAGADWQNPFAGKKSYVVSSAKLKLKPGEELLQDMQSIRILKEQSGKNIWLFGGASLTTSLMKEKLVDEFWLAIHPILLGEGKSLFHDIPGRVKLSLIDSKSYNTGLISAKYRLE